MINFLKSLLPNLLYVIGSVLEFVGKIFTGTASFLQGVSVLLHMQFKTKLGVQLLEIQQQAAKIVETFTALQNKVKEAKANREDNKLADIVKTAPNVVQLGKKKDDDTKS